MRIAAYVASTRTIVSIPGVVAGARKGVVAIEGVFSHPCWQVTKYGNLLTLGTFLGSQALVAQLANLVTGLHVHGLVLRQDP